MINNTNRKIVDKSILLYSPILICLLYLFVIYLLTIFGPWQWEFPSKSKLSLFLLICNAFLLLGYYISIRTYKVKKNNIKISFTKLFKILVVAFMVSIPITFYIRTNINLFNIAEVFRTIILGLTNPSQLYYNKLHNYDSGATSTLLILIDILLTPLYYATLAILIFMWNSIDIKYKVIIMIGVIANLISWILIGTNKGLFDIVIILIVFIIYQISTIKKTAIISIKTIFITILLSFIIILVFVNFNNNIESRVGEIVYFNDTGIKIDEESFIYKNSPETLKSFIVTLSSYLTQGYYGLSLAMEESFSSTLFIGSSTFLSNFFESALGISYFNESSYPAKIEVYGWDKYVNWHTAYTWWASDISFFGVPLLMALIGYYLAIFWKEALSLKYSSMVLFTLMIILIFYIPANNQIFSFPGTFFTFYVFFVLRIIFKYIYTAKNKFE